MKHPPNLFVVFCLFITFFVASIYLLYTERELIDRYRDIGSLIAENNERLMQEIENNRLVFGQSTKPGEDIVEMLSSALYRNLSSVILKPPTQSVNSKREDTQTKLPVNKECRAIFCITTGRSGSGYLHKILSMGKNIKSHHEPGPAMFFKYLVSVTENGLDSTYKQRYDAKVPSIVDIINDGLVYAETNHAFIKTFYDVVTDKLMEMNCRMDIIILRRYIPDLLYSLKRVGFDKYVNKYYYDPNKEGKISTMKYNDIPNSNKDEYDRILSYIIDIESKIYEYKNKYKSEIDRGDIKLHNLRLEELQCNEDAEYLFNYMLDMDYKLDPSIINKPYNTKNSDIPGSGAQEPMMIEKFNSYVKNAIDNGFKLPPLPHKHKLL